MIGETEKRGAVLVTGGTGFIGRRLVERLLREGNPVRVFGRSASGLQHPGPSTRHPASHDLELIGGSITDAAAVSQATARVDTVFHLAGCAKPWSRDRNEFYDVNVRGTEHVVAACNQHGVRRLVHFSTALVDPPHRIITDYQRTKLQGEQIVRAMSGPTTAVIVRPTRVYGPGLLSVGNSVTKVIDMYRKGRFRVRIADGGALANYVFVDDVVEAAIRASQHAPATAETPAFAIGGENATMMHFLDTIAEVTGRKRFVAALPRPLAKGVGYAALGLARFGVDPPITPDWVELLSTGWPVSSDDARRHLGYAPRGMREGIAETVEWLERGCVGSTRDT